MCQNELIEVFEEYLAKNIFSISDAETYFKSFDFSEEKQSISSLLTQLYFTVISYPSPGRG